MSIVAGLNCRPYKTAKELLAALPVLSGHDNYYLLYPEGDSSEGELVWCDMTTDNGGWMLLARSHPSIVNYNGSNWGWRGNKIGDVEDFSQAYQAGWWQFWNGNSTFSELIFGNRGNYYNNSWGPFVYKKYGINYTALLNDDTEQYYNSSILKSDINVYGNVSNSPEMQRDIGFAITGTKNNIYYMRDCCGFSLYGGSPQQMRTTYCGSTTLSYLSGPWCGGSNVDINGNFLSGTYLSNGFTYGGTDQYMIMVR